MKEKVTLFLQENNYKKIFILAIYIVTALIAIFSLFFNLFIHNITGFTIHLLYLFFLLLSLYFFRQNKDVYKAAVSVFWISTFIEILFLLVNHADINLIYIILLPIVIYMIIPFRQLLIHLLLFYILIFSVLYYEATMHSESFLNNKKYLFNFLIANGVILFNGLLYNVVINGFIEHLEKSNREKNILLKELHHRVKNNLNLISSILGLNALKTKSKEAKAILQANEHRIKSMAIVHEILYKDGNFDTMSLAKYLQELTHYILAAEDEQKSKQIKLHLEIEDIECNITTLLFFGIIVNELITNSIKYSLREDRNYIINILFTKQADGFVFIYYDNTQYIDETKLKRGFGSDLIALAASQLKGELEVDTQNGLEYKIFFKNEVVALWHI